MEEFSEREDGAPEPNGSEPSASTPQNKYNLRFVWLEQDRAGGWYRELAGASIEVMTHGHLERVPLGDSDPEQKAREVVADIMRQQKD